MRLQSRRDPGSRGHRGAAGAQARDPEAPGGTDRPSRGAESGQSRTCPGTRKCGEVRGAELPRDPGRAVAGPTSQPRRPPFRTRGDPGCSCARGADPESLLGADARLCTATGLTSWPSNAAGAGADPDGAGRRGHRTWPPSLCSVPNLSAAGRRRSFSLSREPPLPPRHTQTHTPLKNPPYRRAGRRARTADGAAGRMDRSGWAGGFQRLPPRTGRTGGGARTGRV